MAGTDTQAVGSITWAKNTVEFSQPVTTADDLIDLPRTSHFALADDTAVKITFRLTDTGPPIITFSALSASDAESS